MTSVGYAIKSVYSHFSSTNVDGNEYGKNEINWENKHLRIAKKQGRDANRPPPKSPISHFILNNKYNTILLKVQWVNFN
jgi:hypothetical protein